MPAMDYSTRSIAELIDLTDRSAVVTGGARGIGEAIATRLAEAGANVYIGDIDEVAAKSAADRLVARGFAALGGALDASDRHSVEAFAELVTREFGGIDIWVNNAGIYPMAPALEMDEDLWDRVLDLNLKGTFFGSQIAARHMGETGGVILNLASTAGFRGSPLATHYVASKHGVRGLTRSLAAEFAPMGIRVVALAPTLIETPGIAEAMPAFEAMGLDDVIDQMVAALPLGRTGVPDDVARVALFCVSDLAGFVTGSTIPVDGGALAI